MTRILSRIVCTPGHRLVIDLLWEPRDLWWGIYWSHYVSTSQRRVLHLYVCLLPTLPVRASITLRQARPWWGEGGRHV